MREKQLGPTSIDDAVRRALIEVYTLREAEQPPTVSTTLDDDRGLIAIESARIYRGEKGKVHIQWTNNDMRAVLVQALTTPFSSPQYSGLGNGEEMVDDDTMTEERVVAEEKLPLGENIASEQGVIQESQIGIDTRVNNASAPSDEDVFEPEQQEIDRPVEEPKTLPSSGNMEEISVEPSLESLEEQIVDTERIDNARSRDAKQWHKIRFYDEDTKFAVSAYG